MRRAANPAQRAGLEAGAGHPQAGPDAARRALRPVCQGPQATAGNSPSFQREPTHPRAEREAASASGGSTPPRTVPCHRWMIPASAGSTPPLTWLDGGGGGGKSKRIRVNPTPPDSAGTMQSPSLDDTPHPVPLPSPARGEGNLPHSPSCTPNGLPALPVENLSLAPRQRGEGRGEGPQQLNRSGSVRLHPGQSGLGTSHGHRHSPRVRAAAELHGFHGRGYPARTDSIRLNPTAFVTPQHCRFGRPGGPAPPFGDRLRVNPGESDSIRPNPTPFGSDECRWDGSSIRLNLCYRVTESSQAASVLQDGNTDCTERPKAASSRQARMERIMAGLAGTPQPGRRMWQNRPPYGRRLPAAGWSSSPSIPVARFTKRTQMMAPVKTEKRRFPVENDVFNVQGWANR